MSVNGVAFGNGSTFTDKTTNATYSSKWKSSTTLKATGGKYTFKFNTAKNTLTIEYLAPSKASIVGDINLDLQATKDANVYSASVKLNKGNYEFRVMIRMFVIVAVTHTGTLQSEASSAQSGRVRQRLQHQAVHIHSAMILIQTSLQYHIFLQEQK